MSRKYLDDINVTNRPDTWNLDDSRRDIWQQERDKYGFDERETWELNLTWHLWLYERLMMYKESACVDLSYHKFDFKDQEYTQEEMINMILERLEFSFSPEYDGWDKDQVEYVREIEYMWAEICPAMWW